jgi:hypothetical protein
MFQEELNFFQENQDDLVKKYGGKTLAIKGNEIIGAYDSPLEALKEASKNHKLGSFMIQQCQPGVDAYTVTISSLGLIKIGA